MIQRQGRVFFSSPSNPSPAIPALAATLTKPEHSRRRRILCERAMDRIFNMLGFGSGAPPSYNPADVAIAQGPDTDKPTAPGREFACFGAGCFWGVELAYQRVPGVANTEVGYSQGQLHLPTYQAVCSGNTGMSPFL